MSWNWNSRSPAQHIHYVPAIEYSMVPAHWVRPCQPKKGDAGWPCPASKVCPSPAFPLFGQWTSSFSEYPMIPLCSQTCRSKHEHGGLGSLVHFVSLGSSHRSSHVYEPSHGWRVVVNFVNLVCVPSRTYVSYHTTLVSAFPIYAQTTRSGLNQWSEHVNSELSQILNVPFVWCQTGEPVSFTIREWNVKFRRLERKIPEVF